MLIKFGNGTIIIESKNDRAVFTIDSDRSEVIQYFDRNRNDTTWLCSSDINHPSEFNLPEDFDVNIWLTEMLLPTQQPIVERATSLIDTPTLKVIFNPTTWEYEVIVRNNSKVKVRFQ